MHYVDILRVFFSKKIKKFKENIEYDTLYKKASHGEHYKRVYNERH